MGLVQLGLCSGLFLGLSVLGDSFRGLSPYPFCRAAVHDALLVRLRLQPASVAPSEHNETRLLVPCPSGCA